MIIRKEQNQDKVILAPEGRLDTVTAPELEKEIQALPAEVKDLTMDL